MKEVSCGVIRDLLPLYEDGAASEESAELVREHLKNCPACRAELDKLRAPVTISPEEDKEQEIRERLQQSVKELQRIKRNKITAVAAVLVGIILFCVWYVQPRSWDRAVIKGGTIIYASLSLPTVNSGQEAEICWQYQEKDIQGPMGEAILNALTSEGYRADLRNLLSRTAFRSHSWLIQGAQGSVYLRVIQEPRDLGISIYSNGQVIVHTLNNGQEGVRTFQTDSGVYDALVAVLQAYDTLQKN